MSGIADDPVQSRGLAREWEAELRVIDFDRVEAKNIRSQFHAKLGSGKNKAKAKSRGKAKAQKKPQKKS